MKSKFNLAKLAIAVIFIISCEDYLTTIPNEEPVNEDIFRAYETFQGFIDPLYEMIVDYNNHCVCVTANIGGENFGSVPWNSAYHGCNALYWDLVSNAQRSEARSIYRGYGYQDDRLSRVGIYDFWGYGSRVCNITLSKWNLLTKATQDQKNWIKGQAYFFRAFLHWEIVRAFGTIPYLDEVFETYNHNLQRHWIYKNKKDCQAVFERIAEDLDSAAAHLPLSWDSTQYGRITKGAALGLKAKALLYAGSPLFNEQAGNGVVYDKEYMIRAAESALEVIKMAEVENIYALTPFSSYMDMFATIENKVPTTNEVLFQRIVDKPRGPGQFNGGLSRIYTSGRTGGCGGTEVPSQNFIDKFEMIDGTRYKPGSAAQGGYDEDSTRLWKNRDPRFDYNFWFHGEEIGLVKIELHNGGMDRTSFVISPYFITKYRPDGVDNINREWGYFNYNTPHLRLADIYLIYAEAVFEAYHDANKGIQPGTLTVVDAVNKVRNRAGLPSVTANPIAYQNILEGHGELETDHPFRRLIRNERAIEFYCEGHYWFDIRRWKIAHLLDKNMYTLDFDQEMTWIERRVVQQYVFKNRHYWLPFPKDDILYEGFEQNPGW